MGKKKERIDFLLVHYGLVGNIEEARRVILAGKVMVSGKVIDKIGSEINCDAEIALKEKDEYVSRGALKIKGALNSFNININGKVCSDIGASAGGFTQILLEKGASRVYAVDSAYGELNWSIRQDQRVIVMERQSILKLNTLPEPVDFLVADVSLISIFSFLDKLNNISKKEADMVILVKPQYEVKDRAVLVKGVIQDDLAWNKIKEDVLHKLSINYIVKNVAISPIKGGKGNREFFVHLNKR